MLIKNVLILTAAATLTAALPAPQKPVFCDNAPIETGIASVYADELHGRTTASGQPFNHTHLTAAHLTLPFGSRIKVENPKTGREVIVTINDRGPYVDGRVIDLSDAARRELGDHNETPGLYQVALYSCAK